MAGGTSGKNPPTNAETQGRQVSPCREDPRRRAGSPLQCSCLENPMDRGAWRAAVHGVTESDMFLGTGLLDHMVALLCVCVCVCVCVCGRGGFRDLSSLTRD